MSLVIKPFCTNPYCAGLRDTDCAESNCSPCGSVCFSNDTVDNRVQFTDSWCSILPLASSTKSTGHTQTILHPPLHKHLVFNRTQLNERASRSHSILAIYLRNVYHSFLPLCTFVTRQSHRIACEI